MNVIICLLYWLVICFPIACFSANEIELVSPQEAFEKGQLLRLQYHNNLSLEYLKFAADNGHSMAQLLYADELAKGYQSTRTVEIVAEYTERSAKSGNIWAMQRIVNTLRLNNKDNQIRWQKMFSELLLEKAESGNNKAMLKLFYLKRDDDYEKAIWWLNKAIDNEYMPAKMAEVELIELGYEEWFLSSKRRMKYVTQRYTKLAELDYLPAIVKVIELLDSANQEKAAFVWIEKLADLGDALSLVRLAKRYSGYGVNSMAELNLVKSYAYYSVYLNTIGYDRMLKSWQRIDAEMKIVKAKLTAVQLIEAEEIYRNYTKNQNLKFYSPHWEYEMQ